MGKNYFCIRNGAYTRSEIRGINEYGSLNLLGDNASISGGVAPNKEVYIMAYIKREDKADDLKDISIYALCFPIDHNVYIWKSLSHNLKSAYKDHVTGHCAATKELVNATQESGLLPHMYLLSEVYTTQRLAFNHCVAWARYFQEHGYEVTAGKSAERYMGSLSPHQQEVYDSICQIPLESVVSDNLNLYPNYCKGETRAQVRAASENGRKFIAVPLSPDEAQALDRAVAAAGTSRAAYCREIILQGSTVHIDYGPTFKIYHTMLDCREQIKQAAQAIYIQGSYDLSDMVTLQYLADAILCSADKLRTAFTSSIQVIKQQNISNERNRK